VHIRLHVEMYLVVQIPAEVLWSFKLGGCSHHAGLFQSLRVLSTCMFKQILSSPELAAAGGLARRLTSAPWSSNVKYFLGHTSEILRALYCTLKANYCSSHNRSFSFHYMYTTKNFSCEGDLAEAVNFSGNSRSSRSSAI
jgi:hypothetical protein